MSATQPVATRPARAAGAPAGGRHLGLALFVIATAQLMVVLDATIVNVALPHIQRALGFSGTSLEWVVNAYAVTFGGLLLLGGRAGDLLGRRVFIAGLVLFSAASLAGGFASSQAWLLAARAIGLAALGTVAWTAVADRARSQIAAAAARSGRSLASTGVRASIYHHALAAGITGGFLAASGIALAALATTAVTIRIRREDLTRRATAAPGPPASTEPAVKPVSA